MLKSLNSKTSLDELIKKYGEKEMLTILNDMTIRNIDKKEDIKKHTKTLLERFLVICKEQKGGK
jgi:hypothetical protein